MSFKDFFDQQPETEANTDIEPLQDVEPSVDDISHGLNIIKGMLEDETGEVPKEKEGALIQQLKKDYKKTRKEKAFKSMGNKQFNYVYISKVSEVFGKRVANLMHA